MRGSMLVGLVGSAAAAVYPRGSNSSSQGNKADATTASAYASNSGLSMKLSSIAGPTQGGSAPSGESTWSLSIDDSSDGYKQTITGFGGAVTDSTVTTFNTLSSDTLSQLLNDLMTSDGANFSLLRHTIGASDMSGNPAYTYCDSGDASNPSLNGFNLGDRGNAMAAMLAKMQGLNSNTKILGSPWSPPGWMKLNGVIDGTSNCNNLNDGYYTQCAATGPNVQSYFGDYFVKYIQAYNDAGVNIYAITIQNEPMNSNGGFPTMYVYPQESADLINNAVQPALSNAGLDVQIWALDHNTQYESYAQTVLNNTNLNSVAWHCYDDPDWTVLTDIHNQYPGVEQYMTECYTPPPSSSDSDGNWNAAANFVIGPLQNWAQGAISWDIGANSSYGPHLTSADGNGGPCTDCQGLVTINDDGSYTFNDAYYMIAQFSKFMPTGATVLDGSGSYSYSDGTGIQSVASLNPDGTRTVVIVCNFPNDVYVTLTTSSGETWSGSVPADSTTTWILPAAS